MSVYSVVGDILSAVYDKIGARLNSAYDINGNIIYSGEPVPVDYDNYTMTPLNSISVRNCQGIAIHDNVLFQFRGGGGISNTLCLFTFPDGGDITRDMAITSDHGDSATFSREFYDVSDEFPLIYVTADTTPAKIYVNRVTRSAATLIKTLIFPSSAGYYGAGAFDWDNNICYLLAYKQNNYQTDGGGANTTVVSKWNLSSLTDNGDGTYTPAFISQYERPFIYVMQGLAYHDGYVWVCSGYGDTASNVFAMNPATGVIDHTITMSDTTEIEGVDFILDTSTNKYYMVTGQQGGIYKKYTFAEA